MSSPVTGVLTDDDRPVGGGIWGRFAPFSPLQTDSSRCGENLRDADEIVGGRRQDEEPFDQAAPAVARLAQTTDGLHPPERLLDLLALARAGSIARMPGGASVNR